MGAPGMNSASSQSSHGGTNHGGRFKNFFRRNSKGHGLGNNTNNNNNSTTIVTGTKETITSNSNIDTTVEPQQTSHNHSKGGSKLWRQNSNKKGGKKGGLFGSLLPNSSTKTDESKNSQENNNNNKEQKTNDDGPPPIPLQHESMQICNSVSNPHPSGGENEETGVDRIESIRLINSAPSSKSGLSRASAARRNMMMNPLRVLGGKYSNNKSGTVDSSHSSSNEENIAPDVIAKSSSPGSPQRESLFQWQDDVEKAEATAIAHQKQLIKERDGFCRRVDAYDGSVIYVEGKAAYELGNYLGGGVAGVVYEGHRLLGPEEYPVRSCVPDHRTPDEIEAAAAAAEAAALGPLSPRKGDFCGSCVPTSPSDAIDETTITQHHKAIITNATSGKPLVNAARNAAAGGNSKNWMEVRDGSLLTVDSYTGGASLRSNANNAAAHTSNVALEATKDGNMVIIDNIDAPSRSKHYAKAVTSQNAMHETNDDFPSDASFMNDFMEESVAVKILNPVGFRILSPDITHTAVIAREGVPMDKEIYAGLKPMEEKHVWWLINPSSRNLRTLQRYTADGAAPAGVQVDRGCAEKGLRISLIAGYKDATDGKIKELPLTRCIEVWGHVAFEASDAEFKEVMSSIDRVNQGLPPPPVPAFLVTGVNGGGDDDNVPGRVGTGTSSMTGGSLSNTMEDLKINTNNNNTKHNTPFKTKRSGIYRAAYSERQTVYCTELQAYIAIPAVPSKYVKWLRQRRAATKEVRNMTRIGRHKNVVHLFEVLELIQDTKSTMFLILELVRGGELFDLISSNAAKISNFDLVPKGYSESETVMRKFFLELVSGIHYCHANFIAHRDLKPENLLVHYDSDPNACTLKIADFGLSATFGPNGETVSDQDTIVESLGSVPLPSRLETMEMLPSPTAAPVSPIKQQMDKFLTVGGTALSFLTCGAVEDIICGPTKEAMEEVESHAVTLKRMTSVVGSPHYVAPEIISQQDSKRSSAKKLDGIEDSLVVRGYDGTKADVWSAGVILYAMLFRSLPFGEDLLRCPRFQSYKKWYDDIRTTGGPRCRRGNITAPLNPVITEADEQCFLGPHWFFPSDSSPESRDLIVYMLNPDPDRRPSIQLVLRHPWLLKKGLVIHSVAYSSK